MNRNALVMEAPAPVIAVYSPQDAMIRKALILLARGQCPINDSSLEMIPYIIPK